LLEFSRQRSVQPQSVSLNTVVAGIERMLQRLVGDRAELSFNLAPEAAVVRMDPGQLEQVVMNLVINARDAVGARGKISVATRNASADEFVSAEAASVDYVVLSVSDDGVGMDRATLTRIFEPFFTTKGVERGTGLGLSTVYGIVTQSNGHIQVDSEPGKGTTFKIYLPQDPEPVLAPEPTSTSFKSTPSVGTVLLVEKEEALRAATARVLRARGLTVLEADSAEQAEKLAADVPIDVLLVDLSDSEVGDKRLRDLLAGANERVRVLYLASSVRDPRTARHMEQGDGLLERPFAPSELADRVVKLLD
jgi:CheY-like chemotaxis protein